jgi:hypothetical protein
VFHPSFDPRKITSTLNLVPSRSWRAGEPRSTPKGDPLDGVYQESYWTSGSIIKGKWPKVDLTTAIDKLLDRLTSHRKFFHRLRSDGGRVEFFVGWYFRGNGGDVFCYDLLARMADLKIDLSLDVYPPDQPQKHI